MDISTSLKYEAWERLLPGDHIEREYILDGIKTGFSLISKTVPDSVRSETDNYSSATCPKARSFVENQIKRELNNGRYIKVDTKPQIISALGAVPKNVEETEFRPIHDAKQPIGAALNDFAINDPFRYQSIQDVVDIIKPGDWLGKLDLQSAYRSVGIKRSNYQYTGLKWRFTGDKKDTYMIDTRLPFGSSRSPGIFNSLSQGVLAIMRKKGYFNIVVYLDDYIFVCSSYEECQRTMLALMRVLRELGFSINYNKVVGPAQRIVFLGIEIDTIKMTLTLPDSKVTDLSTCLERIGNSDKVTKKKLQSLIGKLNWACQVVYGGRFHLRRLIEKIAGLRQPSHRTRVTRDMRLDITWWLSFLKLKQITSVSMVNNRPSDSVSIDSSSIAAGCHYRGDVVYAPWSLAGPHIAQLHINHKEILALEVAASFWAPYWKDKTVYVHTDNMCALHSIRKGTSKHPLAMDSLRKVWWLSAIFNFRLRPVYYSTKDNIIADRASRLHEVNGIEKLKSAMLNSCYH